LGKSLTYCFKCSRLIREEEFVKGKAFNLGDRYSCSDCAREVGAVVAPGGGPAPAPPPPMPPSTSRTKVVVIREPGKAKPMMPVVVGAILVAGILIAAVTGLSDRTEPPAPPPPREPIVRPPVEKPAPNRVAATSVDPDLAGHYTFDEGQGTQALDATGRGPVGRIIGAKWTDGRIGKALRFNGAQSFVDFHSTPEFDTLQDNSFTLAAWFKPEGEPPVKEGFQGFAIVIKEGRHIGLVLKKHFQMDYWLQDGTFIGAQSAIPGTVGRFYHLAGVVDRVHGLTRLFIDGKEVSRGKFDPAAKVQAFKIAKWRVGMGFVNPLQKWSLPANGIIDDVRFYKRALNDEEIQRLIPK
jgi:hypothetical protein